MNEYQRQYHLYEKYVDEDGFLPAQRPADVSLEDWHEVEGIRQNIRWDEEFEEEMCDDEDAECQET